MRDTHTHMSYFFSYFLIQNWFYALKHLWPFFCAITFFKDLEEFVLEPATHAETSTPENMKLFGPSTFSVDFRFLLLRSILAYSLFTDTVQISPKKKPHGIQPINKRTLRHYVDFFPLLFWLCSGFSDLDQKPLWIEIFSGGLHRGHQWSSPKHHLHWENWIPKRFN